MVSSWPQLVTIRRFSPRNFGLACPQRKNDDTVRRGAGVMLVKCSNPACGHTVRLNLSAARPEARCPRCQQPIFAGQRARTPSRAAAPTATPSNVSPVGQAIPSRVGRFEVRGFLGEGAFGA